MNRSALAAASALVLLLSSVGLAVAQGTAAEARAMLDRAVAALKVDEAMALAAFNDKSNKQFHQGDLYVFCVNMADGKLTAHPDPAMLGTDLRSTKRNDDPYGQRIYDALKSSGGGVVTVTYSGPKPGTTLPVPKEIVFGKGPRPGLRRGLLQIAWQNRTDGEAPAVISGWPSRPC